MKSKLKRFSFLNIFLLLLMQQLSFSSTTGGGKYLGNVIQFFTDFKAEFLVALTVIAILIIIWFIWENITDQNLPVMWKKIGVVAIIYALTLKVPDVIIALGGATIDMESLKLIALSVGV